MTLAAVGCGGGSGGKPPGGAPTMKQVGPSGGAVSSSDGNLAVNIPAGALPANVTITTAPAEAPAAGSVGTVYEIGPTGTQFAMPVTLTLHYDMAMLNGATEASLRVATFAGGSWQLLPGATVDTQAKTVSGVTTHLSPYAIVTEMVGKTCATVQPAWGCAADAGAPLSGGSGGASTGGASSGTDPAGGGTSGTCNPPTCASATNVCGQYPGATMDSCTDSSNGYSAACCFPSNAPICFAIGTAGAPCAAPAGGGASCPPPPTCGSATAAMACAGYPGATLQNCTDTTNGFTGACCFAPEARVCVKAGAGRACAVDAGAGTGAGGASCPPPPRCADANPCAGFVGATADSCTDTADGFEATCCFAAGTLPIASGSGSGSTGGGADGGVPAADAGMTSGSAGGTGTTGTGGSTGGGQDGGVATTCVAGAACTAGYKCDPGSTGGTCTMCMCGADGRLACGPCGGTGATGGTTGAGGQDGGTVPVCVNGATCTPGYKCDPGSTGGTCTMCMCGADGRLACGPCGGTGATGGTTGAGGQDGGAVPACVNGAACTAGYKCDPGSTGGTCTMCSCGADGLLTCGPCGGTGATGGAGATGGSTGGGTCVAGAPCTPGDKCGGSDPAAGCLNCMCGADGFLTCVPCGGTGATGGTSGSGGSTGGGTCVAGAPCTPGDKCGGSDPAAGCLNCMCGADGFLTCVPCGGTGATGGTTGAGGSTGTASGPCQVSAMPAAAAGQPCAVMEVCPDGSDYRVRCDGTGVCTCYLKGVPTATMPTLSCNIDQSALVACGFPDGKI